MFDHVKLSRPDLAVEPRHDGRHQLRPGSMDRESIPYTITLPEEKIAFFTYTWVDQAHQAGAAVIIFGAGVGPEPIVAKLPNRPVSPDMDFSDWKIEKFTMKQDLKFGKAEVYWESDEATIDFTYEGFHPPYSYASNKKGRPSYCGHDRIEQSGRAKGTLTLGDRVIPFDTTSHRDHSWGTRDWAAFMNYRWFHAQVGDDISVHFWHLHAMGRTDLYGYIYKDGQMAEISDLKVDWQGDDQFRHTSAQMVLTDELGREVNVTAEFFAHFPYEPDPVITLMEGAARAWIDGQEGVGWMEMGWQTEYLRHIVEQSPNY